MQSEPSPNTSARLTHQNRTALVTGGGRGIGAAIATGLAARGAKIGVLDLNAVDAEAIAGSIRAAGGVAIAGTADVSDYGQLAGACERLQSQLGSPFDIIVNNAGISPKHDGVASKIWEMDSKEWGLVVGVNLTGAFNTLRLLAPGMIARKSGSVVNVSSLAGRVFTPVVGCHYSATKAALLGLTRHAAGELAPYGIRVNAVTPGRIDTPMVRAVGDAVNDLVIQVTPMGRLGRPDEVADVVAYFTSEEASFVTGQICDIAGGWSMT